MSDLLGIGTTIGAGLNFIGGLVSNSVNKSIANQNIAFQREANEANLAYLREANAQNIAFQQRENEITRSREDNAVQRAAADMTAAGFSKTLAAGNPASAAALTAPSVKAGSVKALNNQFKYESALQKMDLGRLFLDMAEKQQQLDINKGLADAQIANINAQTQGQNLSNSTYMEEFNLNKEFKFAQTHYQNVQAAKVEAETKLVNIEGDWKAKKCAEEVNVLAAQRAATNAQAVLTSKNIEKVASEIAETVARTNNLEKTGEKLVYDIAYAELQNRALSHDVNYATTHGLPVGSIPNGQLGGWYNFSTAVAGDIFKGMTLANMTPQLNFLSKFYPFGLLSYPFGK